MAPTKSESTETTTAGGPDLGPVGEDVQKRGKAKGTRERERKLTDEQVAIWKELMDWWNGIWPRFHSNAEYEFEGNRDAPLALRFLKRQQINWDLARAKEVCEFYLRQPEEFGLYGHPWTILSHRANYYARKLDERRAHGDTHVLRPANRNGGYRTAATPAERGEYGGLTGVGLRQLPAAADEPAGAGHVPVPAQPKAASA